MNFSDIITEIASEVDRTDINTVIGKKINSAMHNLERKYNFNYMKAVDSVAVSLTAGNYKIDFPTNYKEIIWFKYLDGTDYTDIIQKSEDYCLNYYSDLTNDTGDPEMFATLWNESKFLIRPTADTTYSIYRAYYKRSSDLVVSSNETNWLTTNAWEILFYGGLLELMPYIKDRGMAAYWQLKYREVFNDQVKAEIAESDSFGSPFVEGAFRVS